MPLANPISWMLDQHDPSGAQGSYDPGKIPNILFNLNGKVTLMVSDPEVVQDMTVTKNSKIDKTGNWEGFAKNMLGNSFLFSKGDHIWKKKRQATSHAFFKEKLGHMLELLKDTVLDKQREWLAKIEE